MGVNQRATTSERPYSSRKIFRKQRNYTFMKHIAKNISQELNISKATISRALNNCSGVDVLTKEKIMEAALKYGYKSVKSSDVGIVMPSTPTYFWKPFCDGLIKKIKSENTDCSAFLYSSLANESDALKCITDATESDISVLIAVAPCTEEIRNLLQKNADKMLIILLDEELCVTNSFYVGENSYQNGYIMAKKYGEEYPDNKKFAIIRQTTKSGVVQKRINGFLAALAKEGINDVLCVDVSYTKNIMSTIIAREIAKCGNDINCVFCPDGITAQVCLAICKIKAHNIHCIGFESSLQNEKYAKMGILKMVCAQDIELQTEKISQIVREYLQTFTYPQEKNTYVENKIE